MDNLISVYSYQIDKFGFFDKSQLNTVLKEYLDNTDIMSLIKIKCDVDCYERLYEYANPKELLPKQKSMKNLLSYIIDVIDYILIGKEPVSDSEYIKEIFGDVTKFNLDKISSVQKEILREEMLDYLSEINEQAISSKLHAEKLKSSIKENNNDKDIKQYEKDIQTRLDCEQNLSTLDKYFSYIYPTKAK